MAALIGTLLTAQIVPTDSQDTFPTHVDTYGKGGYRTVETLADRDAISVERRTIGMMVNVISENNALYQLRDGITNGHWVSANFGGSTKRKVSFSNINTVTIPNVNDFMIVNVWETAPSNQSTYNGFGFGSNQFNQSSSSGARKVQEYECLYDLDKQELTIIFQTNKTGCIVLM